MKQLRTPQGRYQPEVQEQLNKGPIIEYNLRRRPINVVEAEALVVDLNRQLQSYNKAEPEQKRSILAGGDLEAAWIKAWHDSLQEQIEAKVGGYKDLKVRYGHFKELQNATYARIDSWHKSLGKESWTSRRILADLGGALMGSAYFALQHNPAEAILGALGGAVAGHLAGELASRNIADPNFIIRRATRQPLAPGPPYRLANILQPLAAGMQGRRSEIRKLAEEMQRREIEQMRRPQPIEMNLGWPPP
jgi:hypothetical protein